MCTHYEPPEDKQLSVEMRERIKVFGILPHQRVRPTDTGPIILPEEDDRIACPRDALGMGGALG